MLVLMLRRRRARIIVQNERLLVQHRVMHGLLVLPRVRVLPRVLRRVLRRVHYSTERSSFIAFCSQSV